MSVTEREVIGDFIKQKNLAVVGVSRKPNKFGNYIFRELSNMGYNVFPVNPGLDNIDGHQCFQNLCDLREKVDGAIVVVPPPQAEQVVKDAASSRIPRVWLQQGAESGASVKFCRENGISVVSGKCIMMFVPPVRSYHRFHRFFWDLFHRTSYTK